MNTQRGPSRRPAAPAVVALPAEIDMGNAGRVDTDLASALGSGATTVIVDMTATTFCDSSGARSVVRAYKKARATGTDLRFVIPGRAVLRVLEIDGLDRLLRIFPDLQAALSAGPETKGGATAGLWVA